jgi:hypothetical protein
LEKKVSRFKKKKIVNKLNLLIISEKNDKATDNVIEWLFFYNFSFKRANVDGCYKSVFISIKQGVTKNSLHNKIVWNRRGYFPVSPFQQKNSIWSDYLKNEKLPVLFSLEKVNFKNFVGSYEQEFSCNKIKNLIAATKVGLKVPDTIVTNNKKDVISFINIKDKYITKSIYHPPNLRHQNNFYYSSGTILISINDLPKVFFPSLIQKYVEKEIEVRVFFVRDFLYSMAIFSQNDEKTKIDYRNYNTINENRCVPFILPNQIKSKLIRFFKLLNMNTGSIDLILTPNGEYFFLEINPMGQYDWLSKNCNYYIEKDIAEMLINKTRSSCEKG